MSAGGALLALTAVQSISQIGQGYAERAEARYNANILDQKAKLIDVQASIEGGQYVRAGGQAMAKGTAAMAGMGVGMSGSPMAAMVETLKQINIDKAIGQFNFQTEKNYTQAEADAYRRKGKQAIWNGWTNAFATALKGGTNYAMYKGSINQPTTSFDMSSGANFAYTPQTSRLLRVG